MEQRAFLAQGQPAVALLVELPAQVQQELPALRLVLEPGELLLSSYIQRKW
jgi:hypothetical protein